MSSTEILDGTKCSDKVRTMPLAVFCNRPRKGDVQLWDFFVKMSTRGVAQPVSFFRIKGTQNENGEFSFSTTKNSVIAEAAATLKGQHLAAEATALLGLADTDRFVVRHYEEGVARDFSFESATETM